MRRALRAAALGLAMATPGQAHDGAAPPLPAAAAGPAAPFPLRMAMRFRLTGPAGRTLTEADFAGRPVALFFGYANCESICSVALPALAAALDLLGGDGERIAPVMITVDPSRDTPEALAAALPRHHPRLVGLTGSEAALAEARSAFQIEATQVAATPDGAPVYAHGGFLYLVGPDGMVRAVLPPILAPERIAALMRRHLLP